MEAQVWMTGRVGGEVELRDSASPWATFRLGCTPRTVRGGEWGDEQTIWVTVSCSGRLAEHARISLRRGEPAIVIGRLRSRQWIDANGVEHEQLQIRASAVGHDLTGGCANFFRVKPTPASEVVDPVEADAEAAQEGYQPEGEESGELDVETLAAIAADEFDAGQLDAGQLDAEEAAALAKA